MASKMFIVLSLVVAGNLYWWYRYKKLAANKSGNLREWEERLEQVQDRWVQFTCVAIMLIMILTPFVISLQRSDF